MTDEQRSLENPNLPLTDSSIWHDIGLASQSASGVPITAQTALRYSPVRQAVTLLSGDVAKLPLNVYQRTDRGREVDHTHPAHRLIRRRPNRSMSAFKFWQRLMVHRLLWNEAFALIDRDEQGRPIGLYPLLPDRTKLIDDDDRVGEEYYVSDINGKMEVFFPSQVLHLEGINIRGGDCELIDQARDAWALGLVAEKFASKFFKNGSKVAGILELPAGISKPAADKVREGFYKQNSQMDNAFKTVILRDGAKFHSVSVSPKDNAMTELRDQQVKEVARTFNLPPHKLGAGEKFSYNSLEQENRSYLDNALSHHLVGIQAECDLKLLSESEQTNDTHYCEHNTRALIQADTKTQFEIGVMGVTNRLITTNEWRASQNMNAIEGGDSLLQPLNMQPVGADQTSDDEDERSQLLESVKAAASEWVSNQCTKVSQAVVRMAKKRSRSRFQTWLQTDYEELRDSFTDAITIQCQPVATIAGVDVQQFTERLTTRLFDACADTIATAMENEATDTALRLAITDGMTLIEPTFNSYVGETLDEVKYGTAQQ